MHHIVATPAPTTLIRVQQYRLSFLACKNKYATQLIGFLAPFAPSLRCDCPRTLDPETQRYYCRPPSYLKNRNHTGYGRDIFTKWDAISGHGQRACFPYRIYRLWGES